MPNIDTTSVSPWAYVGLATAALGYSIGAWKIGSRLSHSDYAPVRVGGAVLKGSAMVSELCLFGCGPQSVEVAPVAEVFTIDSAEQAVREWSDFHILDQTTNMDFHLSLVGEVVPATIEGVSGKQLVTAPFYKDGWVYSLASATLKTVDINGLDTGAYVGKETPSAFLVAFDTKGNSAEAYYLAPDPEDPSGATYIAGKLLENGYVDVAGFRFKTENGEFQIWEDGKNPVPATPSTPQEQLAFKVLFEPVQIIPTPTTITTPESSPTPSPSPTPEQAQYPDYLNDFLHKISPPVDRIQTTEDVKNIFTIDIKKDDNGKTFEAISTYLEEQYNTGKINPFNSKALPLEYTLVDPTDDFIKKYGRGPLFNSSTLFQSPEEIPIVGAGYFFVNQEFPSPSSAETQGTTVVKQLVMPYYYKFSNGQSESVKVLLRTVVWSSSYDTPEKLRETLNTLYSLNGKYLTPIQFVATNNCEEMLQTDLVDRNVAKAFCEQYVNVTIPTLNEQLEQWKSGILPEKTPFAGPVFLARTQPSR